MNAETQTPGWGHAKADNTRHYSSTIESALQAALAARGITAPSIRVDGEISRFDAPDKKRGNLVCWCVCPSPEVAVWGRWDTGEQETVTLKGVHDPIAAERARQAADAARQERQQQREREQAQAAEVARQRWAAAVTANPAHPYLKAKGIGPHGLRQQGDTLLVPLSLYADGTGTLVNLQRIRPDGSKRFLTHGRVKGAAALIGNLAGARVVYLCEGWATAASIHEATNRPVVAAMNANNLLPVAKRFRALLPAEVGIIVAADNDRRTQGNGNPGLTAGRYAAETIGASITWPKFPCGCTTCTDFNDLAACERRKEAAV